jgi:monoamine oxidase
MSHDDTVIVGAGIAGLWIAEQLLAAGVPGRRIKILEKYNYIGGRIASHKDGYEIGAGRIHESHRRTLALIRRAGLTIRPIPPRIAWHTAPHAPLTANLFDTIFSSAFVPVLSALPPDTLATHTIRELLPPATHSLLERYPYRAETEMLRADIALRAFAPAGEMASNAGYFTVREGLAALTRAMATGLRRRGVVIQLGAIVRDVRWRSSGPSWRIEYTGQQGPSHVDADRVVLALHVAALRRLPSVRTVPEISRALRHLAMEPLTRIYARYPTPAWFTDMPKFVTPGPLRYVIPINPASGLVMISYTDARDTRHWRGLRGPALTAAIQAAVRAEFPDRTIPEPEWVRSYEWSDGGATYWRTGRYDPVAVAAAARAPASAPGLYCCGESFNTTGQQAWIEGALADAEMLWEALALDVVVAKS